MNNNRFILAHKKRIGDFFFLLYIIGLVPLLACFFTIETESCTRHTKYTLIWVVLLFLTSLLLNNKKRIVFLWVTWAITLLPAIIIFSYTLLGSAYLSYSDLDPVFATNLSESVEFIREFANWKIILGLGTFLTIPFIYLLRIKHNSLKINRAGCFITIMSWVIFIAFSIPNSSRLYNSTYFVSFYHAYFLHKKDIQIFNNYTEIRSKIPPMSVNCIIPDSIPKTFVIIIGESLSRHHMSVYGYPRETNPLLKGKEEDLLIYQDVISPNTQTLSCMKMILTFADNKNPEPYFTQPSIIEIFQTGNFHTYWISAQPTRGKNDTQTSILTVKSDTYVSVYNEDTPVHDIAVLSPLNQAIEDTTAINKAIFIHLMGNHTMYSLRYPTDYNHFNNSYPFHSPRRNLSETEKETVNEYDNTVLYNDFIVDSIINMVKATEPLSYVLYFSDHGQEIYNFRNYYGHNSGNISTYMCEIPFILWRSEKHKDKIDLEIDLNRPYSTEDVIYSISQISGLQYNTYNASKSIFSDQFIPKQRTVSKYPYESLPCK